MRNEWRGNLWMIIELVIVGVVLWPIFGMFANIINMYQSPKGIDFTDIYVGRLNVIPEEASTYKAYPDSLHDKLTDIEMLRVKLKANPYIESLGVGGNAIPYNYNFAGNEICANVGDSTQMYMGNMRNMTPDLIRTLRLTGVNGETSEQLATMVGEGKILISTYDKSFYKNDPAMWAGHEAWYKGDSARIVQVGALINGIRRTDYEPVFGGVIVQNLPSDWVPWEIAFRVKPGMGRKFMESLKPEDLSFGNAFVCDIKSIEERKAEAHHQISTTIRNLTACTVFLTLAVFLGFLGSFWYRTQQRVPEIALRKVNGATNADIFRRFIAEGLILLGIAALPAAGIIALFYEKVEFVDFQSLPTSVFWSLAPITLAVLALMIIAGIWMPAAKAMKTNPAAALKDQ